MERPAWRTPVLAAGSARAGGVSDLKGCLQQVAL